MSFIDRIVRAVGSPRKPQGDGEVAEELAARYLARQGLRLLGRNYRVRGGEIDLICGDGDTLVFVEVRLRRNARYGGAGASVTPSKQRRLILAAQHYLQSMGEQDCRFDCVLLSSLDESGLEWIKNAFSAD